MNESRAAVGGARPEFSYVTTAAFWPFDGAGTELPRLPGTTNAEAYGVSSDNQVVGTCNNRVFHYKQGQISDIGTGSFSRMRINQAGTIVALDSGSKVYQNGMWLPGIGVENDINDRGTRVGPAGILRKGKLSKLGFPTGSVPWEVNSIDWVTGGRHVWTPATGPLELMQMGDQGGRYGFVYTRAIDDFGNLGCFYQETNNQASGLAYSTDQFQVHGITSFETINGIVASQDMRSAWEMADDSCLTVKRLNNDQGQPPVSIVVESTSGLLHPQNAFRFRLIATTDQGSLAYASVSFWNWEVNNWESRNVTTSREAAPFAIFDAWVERVDASRFVNQTNGKTRSKVTFYSGSQPATRVDIDLACWMVR